VAEQRSIDFPEEGIRYDGLELRLRGGRVDKTVFSLLPGE
jgi:hypothetical protein